MRMETEEVAPDVTRATLTGRLDINGAREIDLAFNVLTASSRALIVDMAEVAFVASIGLRMLITGARTVTRKGGRMMLLRPQKEVEDVLVTSGTDTVVPVLHDLDEAIRAVSG